MSDTRASKRAAAWRRSQVLSVEPSSTMINCWTGRCASTAVIISVTVAPSLNTGMTTHRQGSMSALDLMSRMGTADYPYRHGKLNERFDFELMRYAARATDR